MGHANEKVTKRNGQSNGRPNAGSFDPGHPPAPMARPQAKEELRKTKMCQTKWTIKGPL
jgi:hypothetical protein